MDSCSWRISVKVKRNNVVVGILHVVGLKIVVLAEGAGTIAVLKCELGIIED